MKTFNAAGRPVRPVYISINMRETGKNIKRMVRESGYSVRDIMEITGISTEQAVYKWFRGESIPQVETLLVLSKILGIEMTELLVIDGEFDFYRKYGSFSAFFRAACVHEKRDIQPRVQ